MSFSDLPVELIREVFMEIFVDDWVTTLDWDTVLGQRLVCQEFNRQILRCAFGGLRITTNIGTKLNRMNGNLVAVILQQKVRLPNRSGSPLISSLRETANALETFHGDSGASTAMRHDHLDTLCLVALQHLGRSKVLDLLHEPCYMQISDFAGDVSMLAPAAAVGKLSIMRDLLKEKALLHGIHRLFGYPLDAAAIGGHGAAVKLLIDEGANVEAIGSFRSVTALCLGARLGRDAVVQVLLENGAKYAFKSGARPALHHAMRNGGSESVIDCLLHHGAVIDAKTRAGNTALHYAARIGTRESAVNLLLDRGANREAKNHQGQTALHMAVNGRQKGMVELLLKKGADIHAVMNDGMTPLHNAVDGHSIDRELIRVLVQHGADISAKTSKGMEVIHISAERGQKKLVQFLLNEGANVNAATLEGETPLHFAARGQRTATLRLLLKCGADVNAQCTKGITPLHLVVAAEKKEIASLLLGKGADPNLQATRGDKEICEGATAFHIATRNSDLIDLVFEHGGDLEAADAQGRTVLLYAAAYGTSIVTTVPHLMDLGADINRTDRGGNTALHLAVRTHHKSFVIRMLCERGILVDSRNANGETALHIAAQGYDATVQILLDHGADVNARDNRGRTALHRAASCSHGNEASMKVLIERGVDGEIKDESGLTAMDLLRLSGGPVASIHSIISRFAALRDM